MLLNDMWEEYKRNTVKTCVFHTVRYIIRVARKGINTLISLRIIADAKNI